MFLTCTTPCLDRSFEVLCVDKDTPCNTIVCGQAIAPESRHKRHSRCKWAAGRRECLHGSSDKAPSIEFVAWLYRRRGGAFLFGHTRHSYANRIAAAVA